MNRAPAIEINPADHMADLLQRLPGARRALFAAFHVGGCQSCSYRDDETLAEVCSRNEIPVQDAITELLASHQRDQEMLIEPADLQSRLVAGEAIRLFDSRTREEHEAVRIADSEFLTQESQQELFAAPPASHGEAQRRREQTIVLYDHRGRDVLDQCAWFRGHGLKNTFALRGGIDAWATEVDPGMQRYRLEIE